MRTLLVAIQFLTRVPIRLRQAPSDAEVASAAAWFPLVGALVGAVAAASHALAVVAGVARLGPWLALAATVVLTGALHEDGLADTCDGLFGGATPERRLEIMRDSRIGTFGVVGLLLVLGVQVGAVSGLPAALAARVLVAAHAYSRAAALVLTLLPSARPGNGLGNALARKVPPAALGVALATGGAALLLLLPWQVAVAVLVAGPLIVAIAGYRFARDLGGITGDALGAVTKLVEVTCYVAALVFASRSAP